MVKKIEKVRSKNEEVVQEAPEVVQENEEVVQEAPEVVYDMSSLFEMKFRDPLNGQIVMVRRAFKPRGKLEFYCPEE